MVNDYNGYFKGKNVVITGGLGFIGSNLSHKLVELGANVTIIDAMVSNGGGNEFNIQEIKDKVKINYSNICDKESLKHLLYGKEIVFHLAAQMSHTLGLKDPLPDISYNIKGTIALLDCCKEIGNGIKLIYTGSRGQYGNVKILPAKEEAEMRPLGSHEITKQAAENYIFFYHRSFNMPIVASRLSNIYGPRSQMKSSEFGVANWFIKLALDKQVIPIMGEGSIKRDFLYIDDCISALLVLGSRDECIGEIYNIGSDEISDFKTVASIISKHTGAEINYIEFSDERKRLEPGHFYPDITKIKNLGWSPKVDLNKGIIRTIEFYKKHKSEYW